MRKMTTKVCENCSAQFEIRVSDVDRGRGRFCGKSCAASGKNNSSYKHGMATRNKHSKEYEAYHAMINRATNTNYYYYHRYGGRGIRVCDRWLESFENFYTDMGNAPSKDHSLDRVDNSKGYSPDNCRWATKKEQAENRDCSKLLEFNGKVHTQQEWGRITGIGGLTILKRLKRGWTIEKALTTPKLR